MHVEYFLKSLVPFQGLIGGIVAAKAAREVFCGFRTHAAQAFGASHEVACAGA